MISGDLVEARIDDASRTPPHAVARRMTLAARWSAQANREGARCSSIAPETAPGNGSTRAVIDVAGPIRAGLAMATNLCVAGSRWPRNARARVTSDGT